MKEEETGLGRREREEEEEKEELGTLRRKEESVRRSREG